MLTGKEDLSKLTNINCKNQNKQQYKELTQYLTPELKNTKNFAYPNTAYYELHDMIYPDFHSKVLNEMINLDNETQKNEFHEVTLHFNSNYEGKVNIEIKPNETLIQERRNLYKENKNKIKFDNILILYIDAISREQMFQSLPKTMKFIEQYYIKNQNKKKDFNLYQFLKYHNFAALTKINALPMFYGKSFSEYNAINFGNFYKNLVLLQHKQTIIVEKKFFQFIKKILIKLKMIFMTMKILHFFVTLIIQDLVFFIQ